MSSLPVTWSGEGGSATTVITTGNSGGSSGTAFDTVTNPSSLLVFATAAAHGGSLGMEVAQGASSVTTYGAWTGWGAQTGNVYARIYFKFSGTLSTTNLMFSWRSNADAAVSYMGFNSSGKLIFQAGSTTVAALTSTTTLSADTWYRLEVRILPSTTAGEIEWKLFTGSNLEGNATPDETKSATALTLGAADVGGVRLSPAGVTSGGPAVNTTGRIDDVVIQTSGWPGPAGASTADPAVNTNFSAVVDVEFALRFELQETGGASASLPGLHLYAQKNLAGGYTRVTTTSSGLKIVPTSRFVDAAATTDLLTGGTGTFVAGEGDEDGAIGAITLTASNHTEVEFALKITASEATIGDYWDVRVYKSDGSVLDSYAVTPRVTAAAPPVTSPTIATNPTSLSFTATVGGGNPTDKNLVVSNTGGGTLNFTVSDDAAWLSVTPTSGTAPQTLVVSAATGALTEGTYTGHITITDSGGTATNTPLSVTVTFTINAVGSFPVELPGVWGETSNQLAPILAPNGGLYVFNEQPAPPATTNSPGAMRKSTDGGSTWTEMDQLPDVFPGDHESTSLRLSGTDIHVVWQRSSYYVYRHVFDTTTDTYSTINEAIQGSSRSATDQVCTAAIRSDGSIVVVYTQSATQVCYRVRSGGSWGAEVVLDSEAGKDFSQAFVQLSANGDTVHIVYYCVTDGILYYRSLSSGGVLSSRTSVATGLYAGTSNTYRKAMPNDGLQVWNNAGTDRMYVAYRKLDGKVYGRQLDGATPTVGAEESISAGYVFCSPAGIQSFQMVGCIAADLATGEVHALWADAPTSAGGSQTGGNTMRRRIRSAAGSWNTEDSPHNSEPIAAIDAAVLTISSAKQLAVFYDEFTGVDPGVSKYTRFLADTGVSLPSLVMAPRRAP